MSDATADSAVERQANELYWSSDRSVNQIAEDLDLSKGVLYGMIQPLDAGTACPVCASVLVFPNRTARERGLVTCPDCGWEGEDEEALPPSERAGASLQAAPAYDGAHPTMDEADRLQRQRVVWGGALLGAAVGMIVLMWARRR